MTESTTTKSTSTSSSSSSNDATPTPTPSFGTALQEDKIFDATTNKGTEGGLFQACMKAIRAAHFRSNRLRAVLVVTGLFTDVRIYRDVISIFYLLTKQVESQLDELANDKTKGDPIAVKIRQLGYRFTEAYEKDLAFLYRDNKDKDKDWKTTARRILDKNPAAVEYLHQIQAMTTSEELAGAAFVLMGALIIGGGAAALPRVEKRYGSEATHLFQPVAGPGRDQRKRDFIACWDSLALTTVTVHHKDDHKDANNNNIDSTNITTATSSQFDTIVATSQQCMQGNNNVLSTLARNPWWLKYGIAAVVGAGSMAVAWVVKKRSGAASSV